jgi:hypothetical protein
MTVLCCSFLSVVSGVNAQDLQINNPPLAWSPLDGSSSMAAYEYGNVALGEARTASFNLYAGWPTAVWVYQTILMENMDYDDPGQYADPRDRSDPQFALGAFSFNHANTDAHPLPVEMPYRMEFPVEITFAPTSVGGHGAYFFIFSNDSIGFPGMYAYIHLQGTGVAAVPEPESYALLLASLGVLGFFIRRREAPLSRC